MLRPVLCGGLRELPFLELAERQDRVQSCTTSNFEGMVAMMKPDDSWVARWEGISRNLPGVYAMRLEGEMPPQIMQFLRDKRISCRARPAAAGDGPRLRRFYSRQSQVAPEDGDVLTIREPHGRVVLMMDVAGDVMDARPSPCAAGRVGALGDEQPQERRRGRSAPPRAAPSQPFSSPSSKKSTATRSSSARGSATSPRCACLRAAAAFTKRSRCVSSGVGDGAPKPSYSWTGFSTPRGGDGEGRPRFLQYSSKCRRKGGGPALFIALFRKKPDASGASKSGGTITWPSHMVQFSFLQGTSAEHAGVGAAPHRLQARMILLRGLVDQQTSPGLRLTSCQLPSWSSISSGQGSSRSWSMWKIAL